jgi:hypothetical protein
MRLITQITSLDNSSILLKRFQQSGFFNFGNKSKSGGLSPQDLCRTSEMTHVFLLCRIISHASGSSARAARRELPVSVMFGRIKA